MRSLRALCFTICASLAWGQAKGPAAKGPAKAQSTSSITSTTAADGSQTVEIRNVSYEITGTGIPGRPTKERLVLRKTIHSKEVVDDIGVESTVTLEAWPFGTDLSLKPLYTVTQTGTDGRVVYPDLFVADRRLEEVQWWSVYKLGNGQHLFDTYVPLLAFSISREAGISRYT